MPDLASIPGVRELWELTLGDPAIGVALIDGPADLSLPCFAGADVVVVEPGWLPSPTGADRRARTSDEEAGRHTHGTFVASMLFGQHTGPVTGLAPRCTGIIVPALLGGPGDLDQISLARAIDASVDAGAKVIVVEQCTGTCSGEVDRLLKRAVTAASEAGALVVAGSGNDNGNGHDCNCFPAMAPEVLAVGAFDDDGEIFKFSNWGPAYDGHGLVAPGGNVSAAAPGGEIVTRKGTSCSGPVAAGVAALLLSLQVQRGVPPDTAAVRDALLQTSRPCTPQESHGDPRRCLGGKLDVVAATQLILDRITQSSAAVSPGACLAAGETSGAAVAPGAVLSSQPSPEPPLAAASDGVGLSASVGGARHIYALGTLGYDFGTEARRDSFKQLMSPTAEDGTVIPANPYDGRQMAAHLAANPSEARSLIWTLNLELTPIYAIEATGPYASEVYQLLTRLLTGEVAAESDEDYIERVSIPGRLTGRSVRLFSGQIVPVAEAEQIRGLFGWRINTLIDAATQAAARESTDRTNDELSESLREFLTRVYYDLRNLGATSADRALNFAATNAFQAVHTFASAIAAGMALDTIDVEKSPFCRMDSDCWDVKLRFFDPENSRRARKVFRFTIDVSDILPVTLGVVRTWSEAPPRQTRTRRQRRNQ
ncbi:PatA/PatG family cyanobactin maturation protease [Spirillospora sp. NPDC052269]